MKKAFATLCTLLSLSVLAQQTPCELNPDNSYKTALSSLVELVVLKNGNRAISTFDYKTRDCYVELFASSSAIPIKTLNVQYEVKKMASVGSELWVYGIGEIKGGYAIILTVFDIDNLTEKRSSKLFEFENENPKLFSYLSYSSEDYLIFRVDRIVAKAEIQDIVVVKSDKTLGSYQTNLVLSKAFPKFKLKKMYGSVWMGENGTVYQRVGTFGGGANKYLLMADAMNYSTPVVLFEQDVEENSTGLFSAVIKSNGSSAGNPNNPKYFEKTAGDNIAISGNLLDASKTPVSVNVKLGPMYKELVQKFPQIPSSIFKGRLRVESVQFNNNHFHIALKSFIVAEAQEGYETERYQEYHFLKVDVSGNIIGAIHLKAPFIYQLGYRNGKFMYLLKDQAERLDKTFRKQYDIPLYNYALGCYEADLNEVTGHQWAQLKFVSEKEQKFVVSKNQLNSEKIRYYDFESGELKIYRMDCK